MEMISCKIALLSVNNGWKDLVNIFYKQLDLWNSEHVTENVVVTQIKQKHGTLRIYITPPVTHLLTLANELMEHSQNMCEYCGISPAEDFYNEKNDWTYKLCGKHIEQIKNCENFIDFDIDFDIDNCKCNEYNCNCNCKKCYIEHFQYNVDLNCSDNYIGEENDESCYD